MKKLYLLTIILLCSACRETLVPQSRTLTPEYYIDPRTLMCFAVDKVPYRGVDAAIGFTYVPCTENVNSLLQKQDYNNRKLN